MSTSVKYLETVREFVVENFLFGDGMNVNENTPLFEKGIIDSTGVLELVAFLEENFNITILDEELIQDNFFNLKAIERLLRSKNNKPNLN